MVLHNIITTSYRFLYKADASDVVNNDEDAPKLNIQA